MSVDQVVTRAQFTIEEPGHVTVCERATLDMSEILVPSDHVSAEISPEFGRILDRLLVHFLVLFQSMDVRGILVLTQFRMFEFFRVSSFKDHLFKSIKIEEENLHGLISCQPSLQSRTIKFSNVLIDWFRDI